MMNSSAGVGDGEGVWALNQLARDKTTKPKKREYLSNMPQEYAQEKWNQSAFDLSRIKASNLRNTSFSLHLLLTTYC